MKDRITSKPWISYAPISLDGNRLPHYKYVQYLPRIVSDYKNNKIHQVKFVKAVNHLSDDSYLKVCQAVLHLKHCRRFIQREINGLIGCSPRKRGLLFPNLIEEKLHIESLKGWKVVLTRFNCLSLEVGKFFVILVHI